MAGRMLGIGALAIGAVLVCVVPSTATAARPLATGFADDGYQDADPGSRAALYDSTVRAGADLVLLVANWRFIATAPPADAADPADPAYRFETLDAAVRDAAARGLQVIVTATSAPRWAEGPNRSPGAAPGTWQPDPAALGQFARALASRYSGQFQPSGTAQPLPQVSLFQAWTEPNLDNHLTPQYEGTQSVAPARYRLMLNAFYAGVKGVNAANRVLTAGTAPFGDKRGSGRTRPLRFWRDLLCLGRRLDATACPTKANFDILAHHPINTSGGPKRSAIHPDDATTPDFGELRKIVRAAERRGTVGNGGRHPLWATEVWWESDPPDNERGVPLRTHARYIEQALYVLWKQGASAVLYLQVRDEAFQPGAVSTTGVLFASGAEKPAFTAFRFPFVTNRKGKRLEAWGKAPSGGRLVIQRKRKSGWKRVGSRRVKAQSVFSLRIARGSGRYRAKVGGQRSLVWRQR